jgi:alpha-L-rhamnosidase
MNLSLGFRVVVNVKPSAESAEKTVLRIAAATIYRAWVNGRLVARGPARGPHGYYRVDMIDVSKELKSGKNVIAIEVAGYNANSYYVLDQPSFLQAELLQGATVLASTLGAGQPFESGILDYRVQKVQRYSFQRPFIEVYRLTPGSHRWITEADASEASPVELAPQPVKNLLPRRVLCSESTAIRPTRHVAAGRIEHHDDLPKLWKDRSLTSVGPKLKGYPENDLDLVVSSDMQKLASIGTESLDSPWQDRPGVTLAADRYHILDMGINRTGMIGAKVSCEAPTTLLFAFDEILTETTSTSADSVVSTSSATTSSEATTDSNRSSPTPFAT